MAVVVLVLAAAAYAAFLHGNVYRWPAAAAVLQRWSARRQRFAVLTAKPLVLFGLVSVAGLLLLGRPAAAWRMPSAFTPARVLARETVGDWIGDFPWWGYAGAIGVGGLVGAGVARLVKRPRLLVFGKLDAVLPRDRAELALGMLLSVNAGVTEELFFRLLVPLALTLVTGQAVAGFAVAALMFGWAHRYQGWVGVAATTLVGLLLSAIYLVSGALWQAMLVHVAIDLNALVLRPLVLGLPRRD